MNEEIKKMMTLKNVLAAMSYLVLPRSFVTSPNADKVAQSTCEIDGLFPFALFMLSVPLRNSAEAKPINTYIGAEYIQLRAFLSSGYFRFNAPALRGAGIALKMRR